jgi:hypothetical protein
MNGDQSSTNSVEKRMEKAMDEDKKDSGGVGWFRFLPSTTHRTRPEGSSRVVQFHLLRSITDTQPILVTRERRLSDAALNI